MDSEIFLIGQPVKSNDMNKSKLRKIMATLLREVSESDRLAQSEVLFKKLIEHPKYKQAKRLSLYLSTESEIDTLPILKHSLEVERKHCFIPYISGANPSDEPRMKMVELRSMNEFHELPTNKYGIKEPSERLNPSWFSGRSIAQPLTNELDLIIVPGVAFSAFGQRLGHGKGYYDEYLAYLSSRARQPAYTIGLALKQQLVSNTMSNEGHDFKLNEVLFDGWSVVDGEQIS